MLSADLQKQVLKWLRDTGYPLELRVGRRLQAAGWHVTYSRWYRDLNSDKPRELDVHAIVGGVQLKHASVFASLCLECKTSRNRPWVGLSSGATLGSDGVLSFAIGSLTRMTLIGGRTENLPLPTILADRTPRVGGLVQALTKDEGSPSAPYSALLQVRSAALALDRDYKATAVAVASEIATAAIFIPMVVVDGTLLEYSLGANLEENLAEVDAVVASVPEDAENEAALVPVVTEQFAEKVSAELYASAHNFCVAMLPHATMVANALRIAAVEPLGQGSQSRDGAV